MLIVQNPCAGDGTAVLEHLDHHAHAEGEAIDKIVRVIQLFEVALCVTILVQEPDLLLIQTVAQLLFLEAEDPEKDICIYINSPGGSVTAGMAIYDTMQYIKCDVSTICVGLAASMGAFLLSSGKKGKRFALPNAEVMIHQPLGGAKGQASDIKIHTDWILKTRETLNKILSENTGQDMATIEKDTDRDNFMSAEAACQYGLIDKVITSK